MLILAFGIWDRKKSSSIHFINFSIIVNGTLFPFFQYIIERQISSRYEKSKKRAVTQSVWNQEILLVMFSITLCVWIIYRSLNNL